MFKRGLALCMVLAFASSAFADFMVDLRPLSDPVIGEMVTVEAYFVDDGTGHPITGNDLRFRGYQLDFTDTDGTLAPAASMSSMENAASVNVIFDALPRPSLIYPLPSDIPSFMQFLPVGGEMLFGSIDVMINDEGWLRVLNADEENPNFGAWAQFGFGLDPDDPVTTWRAYTGEITGGEIFLPEPASIALLAFGGLAALRRRRTA